MIKGSIQQEDTTFVNIYAPNIGAPKYIKQILTDLRGETDSNTVIVRNFNTPLTLMTTSCRHKINQETWVLNDTLERIILTDIYRTFYPKVAYYTFFSSGTLFRTDHMLSHKTSLNKFKKTEIMSSIFSNHNGIKVEINYKKKIDKITRCED